jgi:hypothetical protein
MSLLNRSNDELITMILALKQQIVYANHDEQCNYWTWDWNFSWHKTDCTCKEDTQ